MGEPRLPPCDHRAYGLCGHPSHPKRRRCRRLLSGGAGGPCPIGKELIQLQPMGIAFSVKLRELAAGTKTTTWRRNARWWGTARSDAYPRGWGSGVIRVYGIPPFAPHGRGKRNEFGATVGTARLVRVDVKRGREMTDADAVADGFPDAAALKDALAGLNRMRPADVDDHFWAVLHIGAWLTGPTLPDWPAEWFI